MTKEQLVELAKQKNYTSFHTVNRDVGDGWYVELCLLQKWLRDEHNIFVIITEEFYSDGINHLVQILTYDKMSNAFTIFRTPDIIGKKSSY